MKILKSYNKKINFQGENPKLLIKHWLAKNELTPCDELID